MTKVTGDRYEGEEGLTKVKEKEGEVMKEEEKGD